MIFLILFLGVASLVLGVVLWKVGQTYRSVAKAAKEHAGFALRKPSLSPAEWHQWNAEYIRWRFFRAAFWLGLGESLLLSVALQKVEQLPWLVLFVMVCQLIPFFLVYTCHVFLLFNYGRFNLERFDPAHHLPQQLSFLFVALSAWTPLCATWFFFRVFS